MPINEKAYQPTIALVSGYIFDVDRRPKIASDHDLNDRYSIVFNSYNPLRVDAYFDIEMFVTIFRRLFSEIDLTHLEVSYDFNNKSQKFSFKQLDDALAFIKEKEIPNNECCDNILVFRDHELVCYLETEYYVSIGGPYPYHDNYNFALYIHTIDQAKIEQNIKEICRVNGYEIEAIEVGNSKPKRSFLSRLRSILSLELNS